MSYEKIRTKEDLLNYFTVDLTGEGINPCPFNDQNHKKARQQILMTFQYIDENEFIIYLECNYCGARGPLACTNKEAIEKWNKVL